MVKTYAFSPGGISSFFEICDYTPEGTPILDEAQIGARGGGFVISRGVFTEICADVADANQIHVFINGRPRSDAYTTKTVAEALLALTPERYHVTVTHSVEIPVAAGFGSSGAGALGTALALSNALKLSLTYNQLGRIAHIAEVKCQTGLGTVGGVMMGGCILTVDPGAPGYGLIDQIPFSPDLRIVAGFMNTILTKDVLSSPEKRKRINQWGRRTLDRILAEPSLTNFMHECNNFAIKTGFVTPNVRKLINLAEAGGAIGAAQNMVGEAVHALVPLDQLETVVESFKTVLPLDNILVASIDLQGARILNELPEPILV